MTERNELSMHERRPRARRRRGHLGLRLAAAAALFCLGSTAAVAQPTPPAAAVGGTPDEQADALFRRVLKDPTNVELNFQYAQAAARIGNYEGAISALERLLLYDPHFPGAKLQLAELYARLGSYQAARAYLAEAEREPAATAAAAPRLQALREEVERNLSRSQFSFNFLTGLRHQSNASAEPAGADLVAGGLPLTLASVFLHKPSWDAFVGGNAQHTYDLGAASLETNALVYGSKSFRFGGLDSAALEVNSGPRFALGGGGDRAPSVRPYGLANEVLLGGDQFLWTVGGGVGAEAWLTRQLFASGFYEFRSEQFSNVSLVPFATELNAGVHSVGGRLFYSIDALSGVDVGASYAADDARVGFEANRSLVLRLTYTQTWLLPPDFGGVPLVVSPYLYRVYTWYDAAQPGVLPVVTRADSEWRAGVNAEIDLTSRLGATASVIRQVADSNVSAGRFNNTQVIVGLRVTY